MREVVGLVPEQRPHQAPPPPPPPPLSPPCEVLKEKTVMKFKKYGQPPFESTTNPDKVEVC